MFVGSLPSDAVAASPVCRASSGTPQGPVVRTAFPLHDSAGQQLSPGRSLTHLDICVLSAEEAGRLENWGIWPACKSHKHIKRREAVAGAESGEYRFLGGEGTKIQGAVSMVTAVRVTIWRPVSTSMLDGTRLRGFKVWGLKPTT